MPDYSTSNTSSENGFNSPACNAVFTAYLVSNILLVPLFVFVLHSGYLQWRKQRSVAKAVMMSHVDVLTFHMTTLELIAPLGSCLYCYGLNTNQITVMLCGIYMWSTVLPAQTFFHVLTCLERYLAVVHPITYLGLRQQAGVRIRNILVGCVWGICTLTLGLRQYFLFSAMFDLMLSLLSSIVVCFSSLSVLRFLIRPRPGEVGGSREQVNQSKRKAFQTIIIITGTLLLRFFSILTFTLLNLLSTMRESRKCEAIWSLVYLSLPCSSILPLLFLHRRGNLAACKWSSVCQRETEL